MPGYLRVRVSAGRNTDTTDAYVEIRFASTVYKTSVCRKSLNPQWNNSEWYTFEVEDYDLQDEPLQLRLMDHDTYSANDAIGKVVISLSPLLPTHTGDWQDGDSTSKGGTMSGWLPVLDPLRGVRGELYVVVKVELFTDYNRFRQSSCGVSFFHCPIVPPGFYASTIHGFVDEQIVNSDPEYQWIDKIRTVRASNEARHLAFTNISGRVQRLIGLKAAELGANAVLGYQQSLDVQGEAGVVARASATAVTLHRLQTDSDNTSESTERPDDPSLLKYIYEGTKEQNELDLYFRINKVNLERISKMSVSEPILDEDDKPPKKSKFFLKPRKLVAKMEDLKLNKFFRKPRFGFKSKFSEGPKENRSEMASILARSLILDKIEEDAERRKSPHLENEVNSYELRRNSRSEPILAKPKAGPSAPPKTIQDETSPTGSSAIETPESFSSSSSYSSDSASTDEMENFDDYPGDTENQSSVENLKKKNVKFTKKVKISKIFKNRAKTDIRRSSMHAFSNVVKVKVQRRHSKTLFENAMETMLMDKVNVLDNLHEFKKNIETKTEKKKEEVGKEPLKKEQPITESPKIEAPKKELPKKQPPKSLFENAMQTMLMDRVQVMQNFNKFEGKKEVIIEESVTDTDIPESTPEIVNTEFSRCSPIQAVTEQRQNGTHNAVNEAPATADVPRRSSDSEIVNRVPQASTLLSASVPKNRHSTMDIMANKMSAEMLEYPFITMTDYPPGLIIRLGGTVCARSVKLLSSGGLEGGGAGGAAWWSELRTELRAHARSLRCTAVLGYTESVTIHEDICILSAMGTAAVISINNPDELSNLILDDCQPLSELIKENLSIAPGVNGNENPASIECLIAHAPYSAKTIPYRADICMCETCGGGHVPRILLATVAPPHGLKVTECEAPLLVSAAIRTRRSSEGEAGARDVSDVLPFVEYELHCALLAELKSKKANAVFGLRVSLALGERYVVALASGTAFVVDALPPSSSLCLVPAGPPTDDHLPSLELGDACAVEAEPEVEKIASPESFVMAATTQRPLGQQATPEEKSEEPPRMFFRLWRGRLTNPNSVNPNDPESVTTAAISLVRGARYKLRAKGILRDVKYSLYLPETSGAVPDEVQILVTGVAISPAAKSASTCEKPSDRGVKDKLEEEPTYTKEDGVILTPLPTIQGMTASKHIGALRLVFVRESTAARDQFVGGLAGFVHAFMTEVLCSVRAHVAALGGNAVTSLSISEMMLQENPHKNHGQCLLSVGGDVVCVH